MCVKLCAASVVAALSVAAFVLTPDAAAAKPGGVGWGAHGALKFKTAHFAKPWALHHRRAFRRAPFGGFVAAYWPGFYPGYDIGVIADGPPSQRLDPYLPPAAGLSCHHSRETVTVPSENGGERKISVARC